MKLAKTDRNKKMVAISLAHATFLLFPVWCTQWCISAASTAKDRI
jgi:hypothetical protein